MVPAIPCMSLPVLDAQHFCNTLAFQVSGHLFSSTLAPKHRHLVNWMDVTILTSSLRPMCYIVKTYTTTAREPSIYTQVRFINFMTQLLLGLGLHLELFALSTNVESGPRFAKAWSIRIIDVPKNLRGKGQVFSTFFEMAALPFLCNGQLLCLCIII